MVTPAPTNQYRGRLSETSLPEMLYSIHRFRVPGMIEARHGQVWKRIFIRAGYVIHAASSDRQDSLGEYLYRAGKLSEQAYLEVSRARERSDQRFGVLLVERELLSPRQVFQAIREHIEEIVWSLFYWQRGEVTFSIGDFESRDRVQIQIPLLRVILEGIKRAPEAKPLVGRLGRRDTVLEPCFRWEDLIEIGLESEEYELLLKVDARKTLYELCSEGPGSAAQNGRLLYAFYVLHLLQRRGASGDETGPVKIRLDAADGGGVG